MAVVSEIRIVDSLSEAVIEPGDKAALPVTGIEVITEVVVAIRRPDEQGSKEEVRLYHVAGDVRPFRAQQRGRHADWGEEQAAPLQRAVPEAVHEDVAARRPHVVGRSPDPVRLVSEPDNRGRHM